MAARSARKRAIQPGLPLLEADGRTHARGCECPRCEAGFVPTEAERAAAARRLEEERVRQAAEKALARKRDRLAARALALRLELEAEERRTDAYLAKQAEIFPRLARDERLEALLRARRAGQPPTSAIAEVERTFSSSRR
jgi:uncharacterized Zn finger protein (UPF0148 family)